MQKKRPYLILVLLTFLISIITSACGKASTTTGQEGDSTPVVRLAHFPNLTHAVALIGVEQGNFKKAFGEGKLDIKIFNAGPDAINALFANDIDIAYIGPNPAINGFVKSNGEALRIITGSSSGGALFIVRPESNIKSAKDLSGKKFATPQLGGTQDVALRNYIRENGLKTQEEGGDVQIVPTENANILTLFQQGAIDGAWVPEPWASRLIIEGKGEVFLDERTIWPDGKFVTTHVIVRKAFADQYPDLVEKFVKAHVETVQFINEKPEEAKKSFNKQIASLPGGKPLSDELLNSAWANVDQTYDPLADSLLASADSAFNLGFLGEEKPNLKGIYDLSILNKVLEEKGLEAITIPEGV